MQRLVIGRIEPVDALKRRAERQRLAIDLIGFGDDTGDGAEAADDAHGLGVGVMGQAVAEQRGIELVGLTVDVEIGPREVGVEEGRAKVDDEAEQFLDESVLGAPQGLGIELGGRQEGARIDPAAMGRVEHEGRVQLARTRHFKRGRKLLIDRLGLATAHLQTLFWPEPPLGGPSPGLCVNSANES